MFGAGCTGSEEARAAAVLTVCPYGYQFDPWPGQCAHYVDRNGSGCCDLSEVSAPASASTGGDSDGDRAGLIVLCDRGCSYPGACGRYVDADGSGICDLSEGVPAETASAAGPPAVSGAPVEQPPADPPADAGLIVLCDRGCSYPGACGRYVDADGSGICDLSEGVPAETATTYEHAPEGRARRGRSRRGWQ